MKKILAVSLCAIMAVSAARADIASVEYVDEQITDASSAINTTINTLTQTVGTKAAQSDLNTLQGTVNTLSGTVTTNKQAADKTQDDLEVLEATVAGLTTGDTAAVSNATFDAFKETNTQAIATAKSEAVAAAKTETTSQIAALDSSAAATTGSVLTGVTITDGKITAKTETDISDMQTKTNMKNAITDGMTEAEKQATYPTIALLEKQIDTSGQAINSELAGIASDLSTLTQTVGTKAAQSDLNTLQGTVNTLSGTVTTNKQAADKTQDDLEVLEATVAGLTTGDTAAVSNATFDAFKETNTQAIATAKSEAVAAAKTETTSQIAALDSSAAATTGSVLTGVTITDGKITAKTEQALGALATKSIVAKADLVSDVQESLDLADTAMQESALKSLASWSSAKCGTTGVTCSLVSKDGTIAWEAVRY